MKKPTLTPAEKARAEIRRVMARLAVPQYTALAHGYPAKQKPGVGVNASI